ncbi:MAG: DegT/DnrJ/EryC1/StrS family aminotransferase, partial [Dehalococcoidia bacterium]|nr:DegT/DnrJ/EryC1/StrS family aminotransferase [Dehalococcoidia bacterium]
GTRHVSFAYAVTVKPGAPFTRAELQDHLEACGVETRPIEAGNMAVKPAMRNLNYRVGPLPNAEYIHANSFFFGNNHGIGQPVREAVAGYIHEFMKARGLLRTCHYHH